MCCRSATTRWCTARARCGPAMPGDDFAKAAGAARPARLHVGAPRQATAVHGPGIRPVRANGTTNADWTGRIGKPTPPGHFNDGGRPQPHLPAHPALWTQDATPGGHSWIDANDSTANVFAFLRWSTDGSAVACLFNFSGSLRENYRIGLPHPGSWHEILNTDAHEYAGSGIGNLGIVTAVDTPSHGHPASATIAMAPHSALWLSSTA